MAIDELTRQAQEAYDYYFTPSFVLEQVYGAPELGMRSYASCRIAEISPLGLITL